jgi:ABC-type transporter Mla subunit MlaD
MKPKRSDFTLGLIAIAFGLVFFGTVLFLNPFNRVQTQTIEVQFRHSDGVAPIKAGSPVLLSGALQVGEVVGLKTEHRPASPEKGRATAELMIVVRAHVDEGIQLFGDCKITTDQPAVGGAGFLVILDVGTPGVKRAEGAPIDGLPPQSLAATISALSRRLLDPDGFVDKLDRIIDPHAEDSVVAGLLSVLADVNAVTAELKLQLSPAEEQTLMAKIHRIMDDLNAVSASMREQLGRPESDNMTAKLHAVLDRLAEGLSEATGILQENREGIAGTVASIERVARRTDEELLGGLAAQLNAEDPSSLMGKIHGSMDRLNDSLENVRTASASGRDLLLLNRPVLERTMTNAKEMSEHLRIASEELRLAPWRLLYKPDAKQTQEMTIFEAARTSKRRWRPLNWPAAAGPTRRKSWRGSARRSGRPSSASRRPRSSCGRR